MYEEADACHAALSLPPLSVQTACISLRFLKGMGAAWLRCSASPPPRFASFSLSFFCFFFCPPPVSSFSYGMIKLFLNPWHTRGALYNKTAAGRPIRSYRRLFYCSVKRSLVPTGERKKPRIRSSGKRGSIRSQNRVNGLKYFRLQKG